MAVNNPFIRYKIYSTFSDVTKESYPMEQNAKVACIISDQEQDQKPFLNKILTAANLDKSNYQIIAIKSDNTISAAEMGWFQKLDFLLCFGIPVESLDIHIPQKMYNTAFVRDTRILQLPDLKKIASDKKEKQKLWQLMKKEFLNE